MSASLRQRRTEATGTAMVIQTTTRLDPDRWVDVMTFDDTPASVRQVGRWMDHSVVLAVSGRDGCRLVRRTTTVVDEEVLR